jgi:hypothetical protein
MLNKLQNIIQNMIRMHLSLINTATGVSVSASLKHQDKTEAYTGEAQGCCATQLVVVLSFIASLEGLVNRIELKHKALLFFWCMWDPSLCGVTLALSDSVQGNALFLH